jgi:hypothetical protein
MNTPVVLIIFRRPDLTEQVLDRIARARPKQLFVVADGPRAGNAEDLENCQATRAVIDRIDWDCEVHKKFSDTNLGCGAGPATGISWAFEHVDQAIILEDDCIPDDSFFPFCEELLERYKDDERVMQVSGNNFQFGLTRGDYSYYFSRFGICWGWATWKRAWRHFDLEIKGWDALRQEQWLDAMLGNPAAAEIFHDIFERAYRAGGDVDYWDYQWTLACWAQSGLSISPNATLVTNLGCREDGTHTKDSKSRIAQLSIEPLDFPLRHPPFIMPNYEADRFFADNLVASRRKRPKSPYRKLRSFASRVLPDDLKKRLRSGLGRLSGPAD